MTAATVLGMALVILLIVSVGIGSGRKVRDASDFLAGGGRAGKALTCGALLGTMIGSQATLGTAQLAFHFGVSAWWFTLGTGIGCFILGLFYSRPLRRSPCLTQFQILSMEYGRTAESLGSVLCTLGTVVSILAQLMACIGFISALFPSATPALASAGAILLMCCYIVFGGAWGAGMAGIVKLLLLYISCVAGMLLALHQCGGLPGLLGAVRELLVGTPLGAIQPEIGFSAIAGEGDFAARFLRLTARGTLKDIGSGLSLVLGILSTQIYVQFLKSARSDEEARSGALWGLLLVPPIGAACICIGLFMRGHYITQAEANALAAAGTALPGLPILVSTIQAMPVFILNHMPPLLGGVVLGTLLITIISGGAGLMLGVSAIVVEDILGVFTGWIRTPRRELLASRLVIVCLLIAAAVAANAFPAKAINDLGFLSMTLRGSVVFLPLTCALWLRGKVAPRAVLTSILLSPLTAIAGELAGVSVDPLYIGMAVSAICCVSGYKNLKFGGIAHGRAEAL